MSELIHPRLEGEKLKRELLQARDEGTENAFDVWWLGQSGFLLQWNRRFVLFDPYLSDSLTRKYASTQKPHVRMSELVIQPDLLDFIDIVTSSHNHTDHLDGETLKPLLQRCKNISFIIPEANRTFVAERVECPQEFPIGLNDGQSLTINGFTFHGVPAAHNQLERDDKGRCKFMGFVVTFGRFSVYHSGDTLWYEGLEKLLKPFQVDVAFLPINGNDPARGVAGNLDTREAAQLGREIGARVVIPHHYNMFTFNTADPEDFAREATRIGQRFKILEHGERWTYSV